MSERELRYEAMRASLERSSRFKAPDFPKVIIVILSVVFAIVAIVSFTGGAILGYNFHR